VSMLSLLTVTVAHNTLSIVLFWGVTAVLTGSAKVHSSVINVWSDGAVGCAELLAASSASDGGLQVVTAPAHCK
jgi:hypothetical protein